MPRWPRPSSIRSPAGSSRRSAWTTRSNTSSSTPQPPDRRRRAGSRQRTLDRGHRPGTDASHARRRSVVGAVRRAGARRRARGPDLITRARSATPPDAGPVRIDDAPARSSIRNKGAYLVGRVRRGEAVLPLVLPLLRAEPRHRGRRRPPDAERGERRVRLQLVVFPGRGAASPRCWSTSSARSCRYKRVDELYNAIGYNKHGKTELFRNLMS